MIDTTSIDLSGHRLNKAKDLLKTEQAQQQFDNASQLIQEVEKKRDLLIREEIPLPSASQPK